jgi:NADPH:quinone reductase-like Zn-dependent oxidoreductase
MNALKVLETGAFENLRLTRVPKPILAQGEALVRVRAAGINAVSLCFC